MIIKAIKMQNYNTYKDILISSEANANAGGYPASFTNLDDISVDKINIYNRYFDSEYGGVATLFIPDGHYDGHSLTIENKGGYAPNLNQVIITTIQGMPTIFTGPLPLAGDSNAISMGPDTQVTLKWMKYAWYLESANLRIPNSANTAVNSTTYTPS